MARRASLPGALIGCLLGTLGFAGCLFSDEGTRPDRGPEGGLSRGVGHDVIVRVDAASGRIGGVIPVGPHPGRPVVASGRIWTMSTENGSLSRIDPTTARAMTLELGEVAGLTSAGDDLWAAVDGHTLLRIDGASGTEERSLRLGGERLFALGDAGFPTVGGGSLWLTIPRLGEAAERQTLWRIEPRSGKTLARLPIGVNPVPPLAHGRYVWIISRPVRGPAELSRIEMASGKMRDVPVGPDPWALAAGAGSVWVGHFDSAEVWRLEPSTARQTARIAVGDEDLRGLGFGGGFLWVTTQTSLLRIDPATNSVTRTVRLTSRKRGEGPVEPSYLDGAVWVTVE